MALLEANGTAGASRSSSSDRAAAAASRKRAAGKRGGLASGYRIAEPFFAEWILGNEL